MPALLTILGLLALVWGTIYLARGSLLIGGLAFVLAGNMFGPQFASFHLGPIPLTVDRVLLVVLFVAYAVHWRLGRTQRASPMGADYLAAFTVGDQLLWGAAEPLRRMLRILLDAGVKH